MSTDSSSTASSPSAKPASAAAAKKPPPPHQIQFQLVDPSFKPLTQPRQYTLKWTDVGQKQSQTVEGSTDGESKTVLIKTVGQVPVTLAIAPPDDAKRETVGSAPSKALDRKPLVRVELNFTAQVVSAPKPSNACAKLTVREGLQQIQYVINNVPRYKDYPNYLQNLPYYIVNAKTREIISEYAAKPTKASTMSGSKVQVLTAKVNVDGIEEVGIILGAATDDPSRWTDESVLYRVKPKASGLTQVVIQEKAEVGKGVSDQEVKNFQSTLNGWVWNNRLNLPFTMDDVRRILPGGLHVVARQPNELQIGYALSKGLITEEQASAYRQMRAAAAAASPSGTKAAKKPAATAPAPTAAASAASSASAPALSASAPALAAAMPATPALPPLQYVCSWAELLEPIYTGRIDNAEPPNPMVDEIDPKTKKPVIDPETKKPKKRPKFPNYEALKKQGDGTIAIAPLGLTLELAGRITNGAEPACENAQVITERGKEEIIRKTHPYTYMVLLDVCHDLGVGYVLIGCTWRPMIGSVFHKLGDALDILRIDSDRDKAPAFAFNHRSVDDLADRFTRALDSHRYANTGQIIYNFDNLPKNADFHDNHLHFTANRLKPLEERDKKMPEAPTRVDQAAQAGAPQQAVAARP